MWNSTRTINRVKQRKPITRLIRLPMPEDAGLCESRRINMKGGFNMKPEPLDLSCDLYQLNREPKRWLDTDYQTPMYSFDRPAYNFWNGVANGLQERGWTVPEIKVYLQSKYPRKEFDAIWDSKLEDVGKLYARSVGKEERRTVQRWIKEEKVNHATITN